MNQELAQVEVQRDRCPFCHDAVSPDQDKTACDACMAWHHKECWSNHGGCSACGEGASTEAKPSPKEGAPVQRVVREVQPAAEGEGQSNSWMAKAGFLISLATAVLGFVFLSMSYSPTETTSGIWAINFTTPKGFSGLGVAFTLLVTVPLLLLGAGFSAGGRSKGDKTLANAGLVISGVYALGLAICSLMAFG
jgi:RING finger family protein